MTKPYSFPRRVYSKAMTKPYSLPSLLAVLDAHVVGKLGQGVQVALEVRKPLAVPGVHLEQRVGVVAPCPFARGPQVLYHDGAEGRLPEDVALVRRVIVPPRFGSEQVQRVVEGHCSVPSGTTCPDRQCGIREAGGDE